MTTYQLVARTRLSGYQAPTPEIVSPQGGRRFNVNLGAPGGIALAARSATPLRDAAQALLSRGFTTNSLFELRYYPDGMLAFCGTVRDALRGAHPAEAIPT